MPILISSSCPRWVRSLKRERPGADDHLFLGQVHRNEGIIFVRDDCRPPLLITLLPEVQQFPVAGTKTLHLSGRVEMGVEQGKQGIEFLSGPAGLPFPQEMQDLRFVDHVRVASQGRGGGGVHGFAESGMRPGGSFQYGRSQSPHDARDFKWRPPYSGEFFRNGYVLRAVEECDVPLPRPAGERRVGQDHEFGHEQMRARGRSVVFKLDAHGFSLAFEPDDLVRTLDDDRSAADAEFLMQPGQGKRLFQLFPVGGSRVFRSVQCGFAVLITQVRRQPDMTLCGFAGRYCPFGVYDAADDHGRSRLARQQAVSIRTEAFRQHVVGTFRQVDAGCAAEDGLVQWSTEIPVCGGAGQCESQVPSSVGTGRDMEGVVHVPRGRRVDADDGQGHVGLCLFFAPDPLEQSIRFGAELLAPAVARCIAGSVQPEIVMRFHKSPGLRQMQRHVRIIGKSLDQHAPEGVVLLRVRIGDAVEHRAAQSFKHFRIQSRSRCLRRGRGFFLVNVPQQPDKRSPAVDQFLAFASGLLLREARLDHMLGVHLEIGRIELEMRLGVHECAAAGGHCVHVGIGHGQFGEPLGRSRVHFSLCHFPEFVRVEDRRLACGAVPFKSFQGGIPTVCFFVGRSWPWEDSGRLKGRFPPVGQQQAKPPALLLQHPGNLRSVALHELDDTPRAGVTYQTMNHEASLMNGGEGGWRSSDGRDARSGSSFGKSSFPAGSGQNPRYRACPEELKSLYLKSPF